MIYTVGELLKKLVETLAVTRGGTFLKHLINEAPVLFSFFLFLFLILLFSSSGFFLSLTGGLGGSGSLFLLAVSPDRAHRADHPPG